MTVEYKTVVGLKAQLSKFSGIISHLRLDFSVIYL